MIKLALNEILKNVSELPLDQQDYIVQTISKRLHQLRRSQMAQRAKEAEENYRSGKINKGNVDDLMEEIDHD